MFSLFGRRAQGATKVIAILDIQSGSVACAIGRLDRNGLPQLLHAVREELPIKMSRTARELSSEAAKAARRALDKARNDAAPLAIEHVAVFLAAPWSSTHIKMLRMARSAPFTMSADMLRRMLADEARAAEAQIKAQTRIIERIATGLSLNGYEASDLSNAPVTSAEVTLATTLAPEAFIDLLEEELGDMPRGVETTYHSFALPAAYSLSMWRPDVREALVVDAGAEVTELTVMKKGVPVATASIPKGHYLLLRTIQSRTGMGKHEGVSAMRLAEMDGTRLSETMKAAILEATEEWAKALAKALGGLSLAGTLPTDAYLFAEPHALSWFSAALARAPLHSGASSVPIAPLALTGKELSTLCAPSPASTDPYLIAELSFADARLDQGKTLSFSPARDLVLGRPHAKVNL